MAQLNFARGVRSTYADNDSRLPYWLSWMPDGVCMKLPILRWNRVCTIIEPAMIPYMKSHAETASWVLTTPPDLAAGG